MTPTTLAILTNPLVIAVDQDPLGLQGQVVATVQSGLDLDGGTGFDSASPARTLGLTGSGAGSQRACISGALGQKCGQRI
jgi:hypothetical protein